MALSGGKAFSSRFDLTPGEERVTHFFLEAGTSGAVEFKVAGYTFVGFKTGAAS